MLLAPGLAWLALIGLAIAQPVPAASLPRRVKVIVLHTLGGPGYSRPEMRWRFFSPPETLALWRRPTFGAHWIVGVDGSIWPRRPRPAEPASLIPSSGNALSRDWAERLVYHAAPVLSHVEGANSRTIGIELAHSGRADDPFQDAQVRSLAWLLRSLIVLSGGRLNETSIVGHKDLDRDPAWSRERCPDHNCEVYLDEAGVPYRRRVDPPEALFIALAAHGVVVPRRPDGDVDLLRAERLGAETVPRLGRR